MTPGGTVVNQFAAPVSPTPSPVSMQLAPGPDGNLWFTDELNGVVGRMTPSGAFTDFPASGETTLGGITPGPDGNVWFAGGANIANVVTGAPAASLTPPTLSGPGRTGAAERCSGAQFGPWMGVTPAPNIQVSWLLNGKPVAGPTGPTFAPPRSDGGSKLSCAMSASYASLLVTVSAASPAVVLSAPPAKPKPKPHVETPSAQNATKAFEKAIDASDASDAHDQFPATPGLACPTGARIGAAYQCLAEYHVGIQWHDAEALVKWRNGQPVVGKLYRSTWTRRWEPDAASCLAKWMVSGTVSSNIPCIDAADAIFHGNAYSGTDSAYWPWLNLFKCALRAGTTTCTNTLGDAYRYITPPKVT